jgi:hypothetical protein
MDETRLKALIKQYGPQKRCKSERKGGCGKLLRLEAFKHTTGINREGEQRHSIVSWCMECDAARARIRTAAISAKLRDELASKRETDAAILASPAAALARMLSWERAFYCELKPTDIECRVNRYALGGGV